MMKKNLCKDDIVLKEIEIGEAVIVMPIMYKGVGAVVC